MTSVGVVGKSGEGIATVGCMGGGASLSGTGLWENNRRWMPTLLIANRTRDGWRVARRRRG
eukprot:1697362-Lingulodinium_polyedra.AAC.1